MSHAYRSYDISADVCQLTQRFVLYLVLRVCCEFFSEIILGKNQLKNYKKNVRQRQATDFPVSWVSQFIILKTAWTLKNLLKLVYKPMKKIILFAINSCFFFNSTITVHRCWWSHVWLAHKRVMVCSRKRLMRCKCVSVWSWVKLLRWVAIMGSSRNRPSPPILRMTMISSTKFTSLRLCVCVYVFEHFSSNS